MIVNSYAVIDTVLGLSRLGLGVFVVCQGLSAWTTWHRHKDAPEARQAIEDRCYLLFLLGGLLLLLNVLSWPVFYLLLQSYVPQWPGVMCIYGVTRIGLGSLGLARFLPLLVDVLELLKPALVFASGAWFVLYLVNRRTRTAPLTGRVLVLLTVAGLLATADAAAEVSYLFIPKKERFLSAGCCTAILEDEARTARLLPRALVGDTDVPRLYAAYYLGNLLMATATTIAGRQARRIRPGTYAALLLGAGAVLVVNSLFLVDAAAPRLLHMPDHHCPYDLVAGAPTSLVAVALLVAASFCIGWACVARWLGSVPGSRAPVPFGARRLLYAAALGYVGSVVILSTELALA